MKTTMDIHDFATAVALATGYDVTIGYDGHSGSYLICRDHRGNRLETADVIASAAAAGVTRTNE
ncbi:hypothetical protein LCGC14_1982780 [marine sediment metagenome]|uniref:Uncharacterized protein n=1 Tax=marine sediment metagenome TaxID=412755 RepID=A0A0F9HLL9_9ZZZZ